jgi:hypothetical protein
MTGPIVIRSGDYSLVLHTDPAEYWVLEMPDGQEHIWSRAGVHPYWELLRDWLKIFIPDWQVANDLAKQARDGHPDFFA